MNAQLTIEYLEDRLLASATSVLTNGVLSVVGDDRTNYLVASTPSVGVTEIFDATRNTRQDFTGVTSLVFRAGRGDTTFYQTTTLPSTLTAGSGPSTYVLVATAGVNTLVGGTSPASKSYLQAPGNGQTFVGSAGDVNIFGGGSDTITVTGAKSVGLYDIVGVSIISVSARSGYALVNAQSKVTVSPNVTQVTFFQPQFQGPQTQAAVLQFDVNNHGILYLNPLNPTANVSYVLDQTGNTVQVRYTDNVGGNQTLSFPRSQVQWVAFFSIAGTSQVTDNTNLNDVFYGKSGSILISGFGDVSVLKIHSGSGTAFGRAALNDLFAGPAGATGGSTLVNNGRLTIVRNDTSSNTTVVYSNGNRDDVVIGVPAQVNGSPVGKSGRVATNDDFWQLYLLLNTPGRF